MRPAALVLGAGLVFAAAWLNLYPPVPQSPTGDVFTSLSTARHLDRGDGLLNDTIYPLFTAYPWGRDAPQPLLHRPPGLAVLLLPAWWLAGRDVVRAEAMVRPVMLAVLVLLVWLGVWALQRRRLGHAAPAWLLLLLFSPLLALAVHWGWGEIPSAVLLLALWLRLRWSGPADLSLRWTAGFALLAGVLALMRSDLLWVPCGWWFCAAACDRRRRWRRVAIRTALAAFVGVVVLAPWWLHVHRHTGSFLANPLTDAVQIDTSTHWWDYPMLRSRTPLPVGENIAAHPGQAVLRTCAGIRMYTRTLGHWLPWLVWATCIGLWYLRLRRRTRRGYGAARAMGPPGLLAATLCLLVLQYAFFSQETRHLLPLLPLFAWEAVVLGDEVLRRRRHGPLARGAALAAVAAIALLVTPARLGGEAGNVAAAKASQDRVALVVQASAALPPGPVFSDSAIVPWRLDRPYIWNPFNDAIEAEIREAMPALREAPWVRLPPPEPQ